MKIIALITTCLTLAGVAVASPPPSVPGVDAPELARLGPDPVGVRTLTLVNHAEPDLTTTADDDRRIDRTLTVDLWYPAAPTPGQAPASYTDALDARAPGTKHAFTVPGIAVRDAPAARGRFPLVVVSHGLGNVTAAITWLTENLASKGYVVAAIRHVDAPYTMGDRRAELARIALQRPLDAAFTVRELSATLSASGLVDATRVALIGYSAGGAGVLTAGGARLDPEGPVGLFLPQRSILARLARGGGNEAAVHAPNVAAIVALAPAGGGAAKFWGDTGLTDIHAPLLLIAGDHDQTVDYATNARTFFETASNAERYLLTYQMGGHAIGLNPSPESMRGNLWDQDWFEDPVWRKDRIVAINLHFITAFLDRYLRGDATRADYLDVATPNSAEGKWPGAGPEAYDAYSPGGNGITLWKGFQPRQAVGLVLQRHPATGASR